VVLAEAYRRSRCREQKPDLLRAIAHAPVKPKAVNDRPADRYGMNSLRAHGLTISQRVAFLIADRSFRRSLANG
jgi:hypothetical protein